MKFPFIALTTFLASCTSPLDNRYIAPSMQRDNSQIIEHIEEPKKSKYQQGIEIIASDHEWNELHDFLHRVTSPDSSMKLELTDYQKRFLTNFNAFQPFQKNEAEGLLQSVLGPINPKKLELADLVFLSEVYQSLHSYVNGSPSPPKPNYDIKTLLQFKYLNSTNTLQRIP